MTIAAPAFRAGAFVALVASAIAATESRAEIDYPWCAMTSTGQSGKPSCVYSTLEQCRAFLAGQSGSCVRNARIVLQEQQQMMKRGVR
jgi:Protein of unknown function (DUF3551)